MSRKHNCKHRRSRSNYKKRLQKRGLSKAPRMTDWKVLRRKQTGIGAGESLPEDGRA